MQIDSSTVKNAQSAVTAMDEKASSSQQTFGGRFLCPKPGTNDVCGGALQYQYGTSATATTTNVQSWSKSISSEISLSVTLPDVFKVSVTLGLKEEASGSKTTTQTYTTTTSVTEVRKLTMMMMIIIIPPDLKHLGRFSSLDSPFFTIVLPTSSRVRLLGAPAHRMCPQTRSATSNFAMHIRVYFLQSNGEMAFLCATLFYNADFNLNHSTDQCHLWCKQDGHASDQSQR